MLAAAHFTNIMVNDYWGIQVNGWCCQPTSIIISHATHLIERNDSPVRPIGYMT